MLENDFQGIEKFQRELLITVDTDGAIIEASSNSSRILGFKASELIGKNIIDYIKTDTINLNIDSVKNLMLDITDVKGTSRYFDVELHPVFNEDNVLGAICLSLLDIGKFRTIERQAEQFKRICENSKDIIYTIDLKPEFKFTYVNPALTDIIGVTPEENIGNSLLPFELVHPDDLKYLVQKAEGTADFMKPIQTRFLNKQGQYIWLEDFTVPLYDEKGELIGLEGTCRNIQDRKELEERLEKLSFWDGLTEVYNKNYFLKELRILNLEKDIPIGIIVCDLDNLKDINDSYGHLIGDMLLKNAAQIIKQTFSQNHIVSRTGGDEFVIIIKDISPSEALKLHNDLIDAIKVYNEVENNIPIMMSTGFSYSDSSIGTTEKVLSAADKNMYVEKKSRKKNRI